MSTQFAVLSPEILASNPPTEEITLPNFIESQERLNNEAREVLPYSFDECTYSKGYIRQSVWSCLDCNEKGVCYGCSISCHSGHRLVELWTKRAFQCDCPTTAIIPSAPGPSERCCSLNPPGEQPQPPNTANRYSHNFAGKFCRCGRHYDPLTEVEAMVTCIACEDWFHESCLNLQPRKEEATLEDDEDEEADCLIPSESYDGLICAACVKSHSLLLERMGRTGYMIVVPSEVEGEWKVVGREETSASSEEKPEGKSAQTTGADHEKAPVPASTAEPGLAGLEGRLAGTKRPLEEDTDAVAKKPRVDGVEGWPSVTTEQSASAEASVAAAAPTIPPRKCAGDIFLAHGVRERLKVELDTETAESLPFPLEDAEIYEPPEDTQEPETLDEVTQRVVHALPRVAAIEALYGYQAMKDKLKVMLEAHVQSGESVSRADIEEFFDNLRQGR